MEEYERVREKIANRLNICVAVGWDIAEPEVRATLADEILSLEGIRIEADKQDLPENIWTSEEINEPVTESDKIKGAVFDGAIKDMLKAGFVKCRPKEEKDGS